MEKNKIASLKIIEVKTGNGIAHAIMVGADIFDASKAGKLVQEIIEKVKNQKMISPPDTNLMLITIVGDVTAKDFKSLWDAYMQKDGVMRVFMSQMKKADVIHGSKEGKVLDSASLL